jgi:predicted RNase H-like nuclease (RuvC/YqgF family)
MFIRKATFEKLLKQLQNQEQEIENLNEKLGILAQFLGQQFEINVGEGWKLSEIRPALNKFIDAKRKAAHLSDAQF